MVHYKIIVNLILPEGLLKDVLKCGAGEEWRRSFEK
jgi:hypothetical protein